MNGEVVEPETDIQIDLNVSSYIPDEYISDSKQKIEVYQNIALCKNEEVIIELIDELIDRFGNMPIQLENLIDIARIKYLSRENQIVKISSKKKGMKDQIITFTLNASNLKLNATKLIKKYPKNVKFNTVLKPQVILEISSTNEKDTLTQIIEFLKVMKQSN